MDTVKVNYRQYKAIKQFAMMNHVMEQFEDILYTMEEQDIFPLLMKTMEWILQAMYEEVERKDNELFSIPEWNLDRK